jgi:hypothetical protein
MVKAFGFELPRFDEVDWRYDQFPSSRVTCCYQMMLQPKVNCAVIWKGVGGVHVKP